MPTAKSWQGGSGRGSGGRGGGGEGGRGGGGQGGAGTAVIKSTVTTLTWQVGSKPFLHLSLGKAGRFTFRKPYLC